MCGAETLSPIVTRGIVVDIGRLRGADALDEVDPGHPITGEDLDAAMDAAGLEAQPGDVLLVRTGDVRHLKAGRRDRYTLGDQFRFSGPSLHSVEWIHDHDIAGVFTDTYTGEAFPPPSPDWSDTLCVHMLHIRDMGLIQGQSWDLEALVGPLRRAWVGGTSSSSPPRSRSSAPPAPPSPPSPSCSERSPHPGGLRQADALN